MRLALALAIALFALPAAAAQTFCFSGPDPEGRAATIRLTPERIGRQVTFYGHYLSPTVGRMHLKIDGYSGAGRAFYRHEFEASALYVYLEEVAEGFAGFTLFSPGVGRFPFRRAGC